MNTKVVYAAGIALLMIGIIFYFIDSGFFTYEKPPPPPPPSSSTNIDPAMTSSSSSTFVNDTTTTTTATPIGKTVVKPTSYQLFESLSHLNIGDFGKQIVVYVPKLKQPQSPQSLFSSIPIVSAQSTNKKTSTNYEN